MGDEVVEIIRVAMRSPDARRELTERLSTRREDLRTIERLVSFARQRLTTSEHAFVRKVLTEAGVSWEAR